MRSAVLSCAVSNARPHLEFEPIRVSRSSSVFVLSGAGISAESGVSTFRDSDGLWRKHRFQDVASPEAWRRDPALVWQFYSERRAQVASVKPNPAHVALAELERQIGDRFFLCTQNVDPLHEQAGSVRVLHMHGELMKSRCEREHVEPFADSGLYHSLEQIPTCACGGRWRPHICWFGEVPFELERTTQALARCTLFVTIGSSGAVYPAARFVQAARAIGARTVYVGPEAPDNAAAFDECRLGKAGEVVPRLFQVE